MKEDPPDTTSVLSVDRSFANLPFIKQNIVKTRALLIAYNFLVIIIVLLIYFFVQQLSEALQLWYWHVVVFVACLGILALVRKNAVGSYIVMTFIAIATGMIVGSISCITNSPFYVLINVNSCIISLAIILHHLSDSVPTRLKGTKGLLLLSLIVFISFWAVETVMFVLTLDLDMKHWVFSILFSLLETSYALYNLNRATLYKDGDAHLFLIDTFFMPFFLVQECIQIKKGSEDSEPETVATMTKESLMKEEL